MKNSIKLFIIICSLFTVHSSLLNAQDSLTYHKSHKANKHLKYVKLNTGFAYPLGTQVAPSMPNDMEIDAVYPSFGKGMNFGATYGYEINKYLSAEISVNYLIGLNTTLTAYGPINANSIETIYTMVYKGTGLFFTPSIVFKAPLRNQKSKIKNQKSNIVPYARIGVLIGLPSFKINDNEDTVKVTRYSGGLAIGLNTALGVTFNNITSHLSLFAEINMINLSYAPDNSEITSATVNGQDVLYNMNGYQRQMQYNSSLTFNNTSQQLVLNQPGQGLKSLYPFSSIGINIGVIYYLK